MHSPSLTVAGVAALGLGQLCLPSAAARVDLGRLLDDEAVLHQLADVLPCTPQASTALQAGILRELSDAEGRPNLQADILLLAPQLSQNPGAAKAASGWQGPAAARRAFKTAPQSFVQAAVRAALLLPLLCCCSTFFAERTTQCCVAFAGSVYAAATPSTCCPDAYNPQR